MINKYRIFRNSYYLFSDNNSCYIMCPPTTGNKLKLKKTLIKYKERIINLVGIILYDNKNNKVYIKQVKYNVSDTITLEFFVEKKYIGKVLIPCHFYAFKNSITSLIENIINNNSTEYNYSFYL